MAQLNSTVVHGALSVTDSLSINGNATIRGTLTAKASSAAYADSVSRAVFGDKDNETHDANSILSNGMIYGIYNMPTTGQGFSDGSGTVITSKYDDNWVTQIAQDWDGDIFVRGRKTGAWTTWQKPDARSADAVPWTGVDGRPTAVSSFTNDAGYLTSAITSLATGSTGSGNVVSSITVSGNTITYVKGVTALTAHSPVATTTVAGLVSTSAQTFAGTKTFNTGIKVNGSSTMGALTITGAVSGTSFTATSSRKAKKDISPSLISALDIIKDTEIVDFKYINDTEDIPHVGFIAEDTPEILSTPKKTQMDMVNCIGVLMKAVQEITKGMANLKKQVDELKK